MAHESTIKVIDDNDEHHTFVRFCFFSMICLVANQNIVDFASLIINELTDQGNIGLFSFTIW